MRWTMPCPLNLAAIGTQVRSLIDLGLRRAILRLKIQATRIRGISLVAGEVEHHPNEAEANSEEGALREVKATKDPR